MRAEVSTISSWYVYQFCTNDGFDCAPQSHFDRRIGTRIGLCSKREDFPAGSDRKALRK